MTMAKEELEEWLKTLPDNSSVGIDDGGLTLKVVGNPEPYLEVGGLADYVCAKCGIPLEAEIDNCVVYKDKVFCEDCFAEGGAENA